jgi:hypothetical protein
MFGFQSITDIGNAIEQAGKNSDSDAVAQMRGRTVGLFGRGRDHLQPGDPAAPIIIEITGDARGSISVTEAYLGGRTA